MRRLGIVVAAAACAVAAGSACAQASTGHEVEVRVYTAALPADGIGGGVSMRLYGSDGEVTPWAPVGGRGLRPGQADSVTREVSAAFGRPTGIEFSVRGADAWAFGSADVQWRDQRTGRWDEAYSTNRGPIVARGQAGGYRGGSGCGAAQSDFTVSLSGERQHYATVC
jgi:hypothetical protein